MRISAFRAAFACLLGLAGATSAQAGCSTKDSSGPVALVLCSAGSSRDELKAAGEAACKSKITCNAWIWEDAAKMPPKAPATDKDLPKTATAAARAVWIQDSQNLVELRKAR